MPTLAVQAFGFRIRLAVLGRPAGLPRRPGAALRGAPSQPPPDEPRTEDALAERPLGCGWFDSSLDLAEGLSVREHASVDAVAQDLPLADWLHFHARGWHGASLP